MNCLATLALTVSFISTHHVPGDYNETNPGLGIQYPVSECVTANTGFFENSHENTVYYGKVSYERGRYLKYFSIGVDAGFIYGYEYMTIMPMAALTASVGTDRINVKVLHIPLVVSGLQLRVGF